MLGKLFGLSDFLGFNKKFNMPSSTRDFGRLQHLLKTLGSKIALIAAGICTLGQLVRIMIELKAGKNAKTMKMGNRQSFSMAA